MFDKRGMVWLLALAGTVGCGAEPLEASASSRAVTQDNGRNLNGRNLNGRNLNGRNLNGRNLNGASLNGAALAGVTLAAMWLDGSELRAVEASGRERQGRQLAGAILTGLVDDGSTIALRLDAAARFSEPEQHDVWRYAVSYQTDAGWSPLCGAAADGTPVDAIALEGLWDYGTGAPGGGGHLDDPDAFTFACRGFALAKCVEMGYQPWEQVKACKGKSCGTVSLAGHHQACTRMLRADYCGDGSSFTIDGTTINVYDGVGLQKDAAAWVFEAEWTAAGAACLSHERLAAAALPSCAPALAAADCGNLAHFSSGTLLMTEYQP
jgi:hypothetical protein